MNTEILVFAVLLSSIFLEVLGLYPGGIIVPAYIALNISETSRLLSTFIIAIVVILIFRTASKRVLLFGRRRFAFMILCGSLLGMVVNMYMPSFAYLGFDLRTVGIIIPGLIAHQAERQGIVKTFSVMLIASSFMYLLLRLSRLYV